MATYLDRIVAAHRREADVDKRATEALVREAGTAGPTRGFRAALRAGDELAVIAEIKRRSPSKGDLAPQLDPADLAMTYEDGGAAALSVLTDRDHFGGSVADLRAARAVTRLPVLRKDFTVSPNDVCDARIMGADCVLLIAAALRPTEVRDLYRLAVRIGLDILVEVHDEDELEVALDCGADLIGVNQRDLVTFEVDSQRAVRMARAVPDHVVAVAESGVRDAADAAALAAAGYSAVLVGESLVTAADPVAAVAALRVPRKDV